MAVRDIGLHWDREWGGDQSEGELKGIAAGNTQTLFKIKKKLDLSEGNKKKRHFFFCHHFFTKLSFFYSVWDM